MYKQIISFTFFSALLQNCSCALQPLDNQSATTHFYNNIKKVAEEQLGYHIRQDTKVSKDSFTLILYNKQTYAATVSLKFEKCYNSFANYKAIFTISGVHDQKVTKYVYDYYESEMEMQQDIIPQLILRQGELELDSQNNQVKKPFFLHLIQDVRLSIMENNKLHKPDFRIETEEKNFADVWEDFQGYGMVEKMTMSSRESDIATVNVFITQVQDRKQDNFDKLNYVMNLSIQLIDNQDPAPQIFQIPMISRNVQEFKAYMVHVDQYLDLDTYSNNNKEHYLNIVQFLQEYMPNKKVNVQVKTDLEKQWQSVEFIVNIDKKTAQFQLTYTQPNDETQIGQYRLQTIQENKIKHDFTFKRMKVQDLKILLKQQKIQSLFQPIYDIVMELFEDKHKEIILPSQPQWILNEHKVENSMYLIGGKSEYGLKVNQTLLFLCDTHSNNKVVKLTYKALNLRGMLFTHKFPTDKFNMQATADFIQVVLTNHLQFLKEFYGYQIYKYV